MRGVRRDRVSRRRRRWFRNSLIYAEIAALLVLGVLLAVIGGTFYSVSKILPSGTDIAAYEPTEATKIISSDGEILAEVFEENREVVPITEIPQDLQQATIAIEDSRFYKHLGVDFRGIFRALYQNLRSGRIEQGGSTLTQQLARNIYLTRERKLSRKLQEVVLALQIERNYSKEQILELYLNQVYYGSGAYGVQTASKVYFGKKVRDLTLAECALLAGLPRKPSSYSPYENFELAVRRRDVVLNRMAELGYITPAQRDEAKAEKADLAGLKPRGLAKYKAPWFITYVLKGLTDKYGADLIYRGGLRIYTTLNYEMQQVAEGELRKGVAAAKQRNVGQGALACIDPNNGHIKAMVGGINPDFTKDQFNRAVQARRQPGSAFKAFVYTAAIDGGYDPSYRVSNTRVTFPNPGSKPWSPRNYDGRYGGTFTLTQAVARSVNVIAVKMAYKVGIDQIITYARMLGIKSPLERNLSLALGASGVTPLEMCSAYGVFATSGIRAEPMAVIRITHRDGVTLEENSPKTRQVLSQQTAELMSDMFRAVVTSGGGTGYAARSVPNAHGKTGTTSNDRDAWFIGYTPELVTAVWVGNDDFTPMKKVWGGNVCAPTWTAFMLKALSTCEKERERQSPRIERVEERPRRHKHRDEAEVTAGSDSGRRTVTICAETGQLATPACPTTYRATLEAGSEPPGPCTLHGAGAQDTTVGPTPPNEASPLGPPPAPKPTPASPGRPRSTPTQPVQEYVTATICVDSGRIANIYCPETIRRRFKADEVPTKVCRIHRPPTE